MLGTLFITVLVLGIAYIVWKIKHVQSVWKRKEVPHQSPVFFFGNNLPQLLRLKSPMTIIQEAYEAFPGTRYTGIYTLIMPGLLLKEAELIKQITVKDFDHFTDHRPFIPDDVDRMWSNNLFALRGQKWRNMRATLSPAFTSSKMKQIFTLMNESAKDFAKYFADHPNQAKEVEMKDILTRYANDIIATSAFGIKCDSLKERNNDFYLMGKELTAFDSLKRNIKFLGYLVMPTLLKALKVKVFPPCTKYFNSIIQETIKEREEHSIKRPDMINILLEAKKGRLHHEDNEAADTGFAVVDESNLSKAHQDKSLITNEDIASQAMIFFFAGFDTVSTCMTFTAYELATNTDIQKKLQEEIDETLKEGDGNVTYDAILNMKYLDMVVSESLRKWPPTVAIDRICTKPYTIQPVRPDEKPVHLDVGNVVWLPMAAVHRNPDYFPDPELFDPERFSDENKHNIVHYSYIPFGSGPRACIGSRFALLEVKVLFFHLLSKFDIVLTEKTKVPVQISKKQFTLQVDGGVWVKLESRN